MIQRMSSTEDSTKSNTWMVLLQSDILADRAPPQIDLLFSPLSPLIYDVQQDARSDVKYISCIHECCLKTIETRLKAEN